MTRPKRIADMTFDPGPDPGIDDLLVHSTPPPDAFTPMLPTVADQVQARLEQINRTLTDQVRARRRPARRWWACDHHHPNPIPDIELRGIFTAQCPTCADGVTYRVELGTPEDDPTRLTPAPETPT